MKHNQKYWIECGVGLFFLIALVCLMFLATGVSSGIGRGAPSVYRIYASFDQIGGLRVRSPVSMCGVVVGRVTRIQLDEQSFQAKVTLSIDHQYQKIPKDSIASILTEGLVGSNYIALVPGFESNYLRGEDSIQQTRSAIVLENLIGKFMMNLSSKESRDQK